MGTTVNQKALTAATTQFLEHFPDFQNFTEIAGGYWTEECAYKERFAEIFDEKVRPLLQGPAPDDEPSSVAILRAFSSALTSKGVMEDGRPQNMVDWRSHAHLQKLEGELAIDAAKSIHQLWSRKEFPAEALDSFAQSYGAVLSRYGGKKSGANGIIRSLGTLLLALGSPEKAIWIRSNLWSNVARVLTGQIIFSNNLPTRDEYAAALEISADVFFHLEQLGWKPRDYWDVHNFFWVSIGQGKIPNLENTRHAGAQATTTESADRAEQRIMTTNLILYGPPGTGKTYRTALEAVRLCLGDEEAQKLADNRSDLMGAYRDLVSSERIEFVTFHQSFSYEDFVEGLRPTTSYDDQVDDGAPSEQSGGFSLKVHDGVFKRISERARQDTGGDTSDDRLDRSRTVFKVALGRRTSEENRILFGLENDLIHTRWGGDIDWSDERFDDFHEVLAEWREKKDPSASGKEGNTELTYAFRGAIQIGDYVVISDGRDLVRAFGEVVGDYYYEGTAEFHPHRRRVKWLWRDDNRIDRSRIYAKPFRQQSVYRLDPKAIDWDALDEIILGKDIAATSEHARDHVLIIDEINRANISKVFGELITLLEPDKRLGSDNEIRLQLPYSGKPFGVPANLHIIGTMNTADRSIALLDTALRRRFVFKELMPDATLLPANVDGVNLQKLLTRINERIEYLFDREHQIGHAYFIKCRTKADIEAVMRDAIIPLLAEYFYDDWSKIAVVLEGRPIPEEGNYAGRFLDGQRLSLDGFDDQDFASNARLRWSVKPSFDFSEFASA